MFTPLFERVLIQRSEISGTTASGLIVPGQEKDKAQEGTILNVGDDVTKVKVGDVVAFEKFSGTEMMLGGKEYIVMDEKKVLGFISRVETKGE